MIDNFEPAIANDNKYQENLKWLYRISLHILKWRWSKDKNHCSPWSALWFWIDRKLRSLYVIISFTPSNLSCDSYLGLWWNVTLFSWELGIGTKVLVLFWLLPAYIWALLAPVSVSINYSYLYTVYSRFNELSFLFRSTFRWSGAPWSTFAAQKRPAPFPSL